MNYPPFCKVHTQAIFTPPKSKRKRNRSHKKKEQSESSTNSTDPTSVTPYTPSFYPEIPIDTSILPAELRQLYDAENESKKRKRFPTEIENLDEIIKEVLFF